MWICSLWLTLVKLMSNFICLDGSLRFGPNSVTFCNDLLHYDCLSKAYLGAGVLALTQDILSHALAARRLGEGAMPHCDRSGLRRKNRHHQPGSTSKMPISRAPSSPLDERSAGCKINTAGGQNLPTMGSPSQRFDPSFVRPALGFGGNAKRPTLPAYRTHAAAS